jgi:hypothetical protein
MRRPPTASRCGVLPCSPDIALLGIHIPHMPLVAILSFLSSLTLLSFASTFLSQPSAMPLSLPSMPLIHHGHGRARS